MTEFAAGLVLGLWLGIFATWAVFEWRRDRLERSTVYRRWAAWEFQDWLRRHTPWRQRR